MNDNVLPDDDTAPPPTRERRRHPIKRHRSLMILAIILPALLIVIIKSCTGGKHYDDFDPEKEGIIDVIVNAGLSVLSGRQENETRYYTLASDRRMRLTDAFEPDVSATYTVPHGCFESYTDRSKNKVLNRLNYMALMDADQKQLTVSEKQARVFRRIAELEHDLFMIRFIETGGQIFVYIELNVNLWDPCDLYWYDPDADSLVLLHEWDNEEVIGLRLRNIALAK